MPELAKALTNGATAVVAPAALVKGKSLGDPVGSSFGAGAPLTVAISGTDADSATIKKFVAALAGVQGFTVKLNMDALETEAQAVSDYGLTEDEPDLSTLVWSGAPKSSRPNRIGSLAAGSETRREAPGATACEEATWT